MAMRERWITIDDTEGTTRRLRLDDWLAREMPVHLRNAWDDPDALYALVAPTIEAGAGEAVEEAVGRLEQLEGTSERQAVALALIHVGTGRPGEAEQVLRRYVRRHGETPIVATNLAKALWAQGRERDARVQLRHALALDPNLENALHWWASIHGTEGGDASYQQALLDVTAEAGAWRAHLLLARQYQQHGRYDEARETLGYVLANFNDCKEAHEAARDDLKALDDLERATTSTGRASVSTETERPRPVRMAAVPLFSPVWTRGLDDPDWILEPAAEDAPSIYVFVFADARPGLAAADAMEAQVETAHGRLTRALPLYLTERLQLLTDVRVATVIPVVLNSGLFLATTPFAIETMVRWCPPAFPPRMVIGGTFLDRDLLQLDVWDIKRPQHVSSEEVPAGDPVLLAGRLEERVVRTIVERDIGSLRPVGHADRFVPSASRLEEAWLQGSAHLLTQLLAASRVIPATNIWNEPNMYHTWFGLCALYPDLLAPRLMAIGGVLAGLHQGSPHAAAFVEGVRALLSEPGGHAGVIDRLSPLVLRRLGDVAAAEKAAERLLSEPDDRYVRWLARVMRTS